MSEEYITKTQVRELMERYYENANLRQDHFLRSVFRDIKALPAADVVEVVHGEWVADTDGMLHCSNCCQIPTNRIIINGSLVYDMTPVRARMRYCPKCGAKMDGGDHDAID